MLAIDYHVVLCLFFPEHSYACPYPLECACMLTFIFCFRYIITCIDYYSKWVEAKALPTKEGHGVAQFLYSLICRHAWCTK